MGSLMLINKAEPIAMSAYPLKSKYSWKVYDNERAQASMELIIMADEWPEETNPANESAITTFLNNPIEKINKPKEIFLIFIFLFERSSNCGIKALWWTIGPAISWGKKETYVA